MHSWPRTNTGDLLAALVVAERGEVLRRAGRVGLRKVAVICSTALSRLGSASCGRHLLLRRRALRRRAQLRVRRRRAAQACLGAAALAPPRPKRSRIDDMPPAAAAPTALVPPAPESRRPLPNAKLVALCPCDARLGIADARRPADA